MAQNGHLVRHAGEGVRIGHLRSSRRLLEALVVGEIDDSPAFRTALGGHENHSVGRTRTVDSRLGILQHVDTLDVIGVDLADVSPFDAVHDDQRRVVARRAPAADEYLRVGSTRITRTGVHDQARKTSRQRGSDINGRAGGDLFTFDRNHRTGQRRLFARTVAHHHHFVDGCRGLLQHDFETASHPYGNALRSISDKIHQQHVLRCGINRKAALGIGRHTERRTFYNDRRTADGIAPAVLDRSGPRRSSVVRRCGTARRRGSAGQQQSEREQRREQTRPPRKAEPANQSQNFLHRINNLG